MYDFTKLWNLMRTRGLTARKLAQLANIHPQTLSRMKGSNNKCTPKTLEKICKALQCELKDICELRGS